MKVHVGIIGCGGIASAHMHALQNIECVDRINVFDIDENKATDLSNKFSKVVFNSKIDDAVNNSDCIIITTPNDTHLSVLKQIIKIKKIPVLCEKPLASSLDDAILFEKLAPEYSCIGLNYRFNAIIETIVTTIDNRDLGDTVFIDLAFNKNSAFSKKDISWRDLKSQGKSSGSFGDLSSHLIDLVSYITKSDIKESSVRASLGTKVSSRNNVRLHNDDYSIATGTTISNINFKIKSTKSALDSDVGFHVIIICKYGEISYSSNNPYIINLQYNNSMDVINIPICHQKILNDPLKEIPYWADSFYFQNKRWIDSINNRCLSKNLASIQDGIKIQSIIENVN